MSRWARLLATGLCLASTGAALGKARVRPPPTPVVLDYRRLAGAEPCPSKPELEAEVRKILGRAPFARKAPRTIRCVLRAESGGIAARMQLLDSRSRRVLGVRELFGAGASCEELGESVALAIALAIDPLARPPRAAVVPGRGASSALEAASPPAGASGSTAGAAVTGVSVVPRGGRPPRGGLLPDAGTVGALGLVPLAVVERPDAGGPPARLDAGFASPDADAGVRAQDAGALVDAGARAADAGAPPPDAGAGIAGTRASPDAGPPLAPDVVATEARAPVVAAETPPRRTGWRAVVGAEAIGAAGVLPGFAGGVLLHAGMATEAASVELEGRWLPGTRRAHGAGSVSTSLVSGSLVGCARFGSWAACGLALTGPLSGTGEGYSRTQEASAWIVSAGARAQWEWLFADPVGLRLHLDGAVNLVRPRFLVDSQEAWAVPPLSVWVGGGLFGRF